MAKVKVEKVDLGEHMREFGAPDAAKFDGFVLVKGYPGEVLYRGERVASIYIGRQGGHYAYIESLGKRTTVCGSQLGAAYAAARRVKREERKVAK